MKNIKYFIFGYIGTWICLFFIVIFLGFLEFIFYWSISETKHFFTISWNQIETFRLLNGVAIIISIIIFLLFKKPNQND